MWSQPFLKHPHTLSLMAPGFSSTTVLVPIIETEATSSSGYYCVINLSWQFLHMLALGPPLALSPNCFFPTGVHRPTILHQPQGMRTFSYCPFPLFQKYTPGGTPFQLIIPPCEWKSVLKSTRVMHAFKICLGLLVDLSDFFVCIFALRGPLKNGQGYSVLNVTHLYDIIGF